MKKIIKSIVSLGLMGIFAMTGFACNEADNKAESSKSSETPKTEITNGLASVALAVDTVNLTIGDTKQLLASVEGSDEALEWYSENETVASVDNQGTVTANGVGTTRIVASLNEYVKAFCEVKVTAYFENSYYISLDRAQTQVYAGDAFDLQATLTYGSRTLDSRMITWQSSNDLVATVDYLGKVTAHCYGSTTISAIYSVDGEEKAVATCSVKVLNDYTVILENTDEITTVLPGETFALTPVVYDENGTEMPVNSEEIVFGSGNDNIIRYENGRFQAVASGCASVYASYCGIVATYEVRVWGLQAEDFNNVNLANVYGVTDVMNKGFVYSGIASGRSHVVLSLAKWQAFLDAASAYGYTAIAMKIYSVDGTVELRPNNTNNSLFLVSDNTSIDKNDCSYDCPYTTTMSIEDCKKLNGLVVGMLSGGSFEFTITPVK